MLASFNVGGPWSVGLEQNFVFTMEILQQHYPDLDSRSQHNGPVLHGGMNASLAALQAGPLTC